MELDSEQYKDFEYKKDLVNKMLTDLGFGQSQYINYPGWVCYLCDQLIRAGWRKANNDQET